MTDETRTPVDQEDFSAAAPPPPGAARTAEPSSGAAEAPPAGEGVGGEAGEELAAVRADLDALTKQRDDYLALAQRTQADFENFRKRMARENAVALDRGMTKLAKELLPA